MADTRVTTEFDDTVTAPAAVRHFVCEQLDAWQLNHLIDVVELLVSEVVTNSVRHAHAGGVLEMRRVGNIVRVEVIDSGGGTPEVQAPSLDRIDGRGLAIVETLSKRWGVEEANPAGKTVWFEVSA